MRRWTPVFVVLLVSVTVFTLVYAYNASRTPSWDPICDHSSRRTNEWGTKAFRELLEESGVRTGTWGAPLTELSPEVQQLWIINPQRAVSETEVERLVAWVAEGGRAIIAPDPRNCGRGLAGGAGGG